jgi:hypothetical protein
VWDSFLGEAEYGYFVLGCMDLERAFALPVLTLREQLSHMSTTTKADGTSYWHIKIIEPSPNRFALQLPKTGKSFALEQFAFSLKPVSGVKG